MKRKVTLYVEERLIEEAKKHKINLSRFLEYYLRNFLEKASIEVENREPKLVVLARCPNGHETAVVLIDAFGNYRSDRVYCKVCGKRFRIKRRIITILKGSRNLYAEWYSKRFNTPFTV